MMCVCRGELETAQDPSKKVGMSARCGATAGTLNLAKLSCQTRLVCWVHRSGTGVFGKFHVCLAAVRLVRILVFWVAGIPCFSWLTCLFESRLLDTLCRHCVGPCVLLRPTLCRRTAHHVESKVRPCWVAHGVLQDMNVCLVLCCCHSCHSYCYFDLAYVMPVRKLIPHGEKRRLPA